MDNYKVVDTYKGYVIKKRVNTYSISKTEHSKVIYSYFTSVDDAKKFIDDNLKGGVINE